MNEDANADGFAVSVLEGIDLWSSRRTAAQHRDRLRSAGRFARCSGAPAVMSVQQLKRATLVAAQPPVHADWDWELTDSGDRRGGRVHQRLPVLGVHRHPGLDLDEVVSAHVQASGRVERRREPVARREGVVQQRSRRRGDDRIGGVQGEVLGQVDGVRIGLQQQRERDVDRSHPDQQRRRPVPRGDREQHAVPVSDPRWTGEERRRHAGRGRGSAGRPATGCTRSSSRATSPRSTRVVGRSTSISRPGRTGTRCRTPRSPGARFPRPTWARTATSTPTATPNR